MNRIETECLQRINDSHEMFKNAQLQNETLSIAFKVDQYLIEIIELVFLSGTNRHNGIGT